MPITLSDDESALLFCYLWREHQVVWDPEYVGETTKIGRRLWHRVQEIAKNEGVDFRCHQHRLPLKRL